MPPSLNHTRASAPSSTYNIMPKTNVSMHRDFHAGNIPGAMLLQERANAMIAKVSGGWPVAFVRAHVHME